MTRDASRRRRRSRPEVDERECRYCGERRLPLEIEHVRPLCRGGTDSGTVIACMACNRQKGMLLLHEWMAWRERNGLSWPPVASHATSLQPEHYKDGTGCDSCHGERDREDLPPLLVPEELILSSTGYRGRYRCPVHQERYLVGWGVSPFFFDDCPCGFCVATRKEEGALR